MSRIVLSVSGAVSKQFRNWAELWVSEHRLSHAVDDGDEAAVEKVAHAQLSAKEATQLLNYLFPRKSRSSNVTRRLKKLPHGKKVGVQKNMIEEITDEQPDLDKSEQSLDDSLSSNTARRRRNRLNNQDKISGDHLSSAPSKTTRRAKINRLKKKLVKPAQQDIHADHVHRDNDTGEAIVKEVISLSNKSLSSDVIFVPSTQSTKYSAMRAAKTNLQRRMPGYVIDCTDISGEGLITFLAKTNVTFDECEATIFAKCVASPTDMSAHAVEVTCNERTFKIEPADMAVSPEDALKMLHKIAESCVRNM